MELFQAAAAFLVLSGAASLIYQVTWVRLLGLSLGSTSASISTVVAAFFLGMAIGSLLAERITRGRINSLMPYIGLEVLIGLSGLAMMPLLLNFDALLAVFPAIGSELALKFVVAALVLAIPTTCMGATFPVMAAILVRREEKLGRRISALYGFNTFGAVLGAALSGFLIIPAIGLDGATYVAVGLNFLVVALALITNSQIKLPPIALPEPTTSDGKPALAGRIHWPALVTLFLTGFASIAIQVGWTKYLAIFTGSTIYGLSAVLAVFLSGIAAGSWAIGPIIDKLRNPNRVMGIGLLLLGLFMILARVGLSYLPDVQDLLATIGASSLQENAVRLTIVLLVIFPPTFMFGALFPLNLKLYCGDFSGVRSRIGQAYAINTVASILGATLAGFWAIPLFGTDALLTVVAAGFLLLPLFWVLDQSSWIYRVALPVAVVVGFAGNQFLPHLDYQRLIASVRYDDAVDPDFLFLKEGRGGVVSLVTDDGVYARLQNNGLNESRVNVTDENDVLLSETLLGLVPYLVNPDAKSAFMLGFGGGITTGTLARTPLEKIRVVELEPSVVDAIRTIENGPAKVLDDPRVTLEFNDARNALLVEAERYDLIVSQPSHPWLSGAANVFTKEFWSIANDRLNEKGVFAQWINLFQMDATTLKALMQSFYSVYDYGFSVANLGSGDLILIGSDSPLTLDPARVDPILQSAALSARLRGHNIYSTQDILWFYSLSRDEALAAADGATPNSDTNILSEVRLSALTGDPTGDEDPYEFLRSHWGYDVVGLLGNDAQARLDALGHYFLGWKNTDAAERVAIQLAKYDPKAAAVIDHQRLILSNDYAGATALYATRSDWPEESEIAQANALMDVGDLTGARAALTKPTSGWVAEARLAYLSDDWTTLSLGNSATGDARAWYLLGLAKRQPLTAGAELSKLTLEGPLKLPALRFLVQYGGMIGDSNLIDTSARALVTELDAETARLGEIAKMAEASGDAAMAEAAAAAVSGLS